MRFKLNSDRVVTESLDGEVIIIHLKSGKYFSLQDSGADIWAALLAGLSAAEIADRFDGKTSFGKAQILAEVTDFAQSLVNEDLMTATEEASTVGAASLQFAGAYSSPKLEIYTDMQDWMLVDPIHEVTQQGWPIKKPADS